MTQDDQAFNAALDSLRTMWLDATAYADTDSPRLPLPLPANAGSLVVAYISPSPSRPGGRYPLSFWSR